MIRVAVTLGPRAYLVQVGSGGLEQLGAVVREQGGAGGFSAAALVADGGLPSALVERARAQLQGLGLGVTETRLRGERAKSLGTVLRLCTEFRRSALDRRALVVALGGGVVGDVAGFAAAVYLRGIALLHCPTTLQAMVDSAIGGKTGVNLAVGKNLVGAVHQPVAVVCDPELLRGLPPRDRRAAFGEIVKYGMVSDPEVLSLLDELGPGAGADDPARLEPLIARCVAAKAEVVTGDEHDHGRRAILNYGHTIGHALESTLGYGRLRHGEAVAIGMRVAGRLSVELRDCPAADIAEQDRRLDGFRLGCLPRGLDCDPAQLLAAARHDKKVVDGDPRWVLLDRLGHATAGHRVPPARALAALQEVLAS
ncbi:MAG TPA: 3-dehydroquinate synthase family protein [Verrucomicrobiae bacterium]|nr:3-dehydroquinate synthase family protein [Verrucomicrobiae bacterium]